LSTLSPAERTLRARAAAHALHAQGKTTTAAARRAFLARFERQVDPERVLAPAERARRAEHARKAYMSDLAARSARSRRQRRQEAA
jgi:predicted DsbA family dithiol-disulfide isomerase